MTPDGSLSELLAAVRDYNPGADCGKLTRAYDFMVEAHEGQQRKSGEPFASHPLAVAAILAEYRVDVDTIAGALLHDTVEDSAEISVSDVDREFGPRIAALVEGVTKVGKVVSRNIAGREETAEENGRFAGGNGKAPDITPSRANGGAARDEVQAETLHKILVSLAKDLRVLLIKLADRLHNMRTIEALPLARRRRIANETLAVYAPLAARVGMQEMREEFEDLAFGVLNPRARRAIIRRFVSLKKRYGSRTQRMIEQLRGALRENGIEAEVQGRYKRPYSIWRKVRRKKVEFARLSDIAAFRIIVEDVPDCYRALGALHSKWHAVSDRFKDYISVPKENGYQSLHTVLHGEDMPLMEVQIRSRDMHHVAEVGIAAHWRYKGNEDVEPSAALEGKQRDKRARQEAKDPLAKLRDWLDAARNSGSPGESVDLAMYEHRSGNIYCFTPKGRVVHLPRNAIPVDFAYALHTEIGNSCVGAKVDGARAPLKARLRSGQEVEILRSDGAHPDLDWINDVATEKARHAISRYWNTKKRQKSAEFGERMAVKVFGEGSAEALRAAARQLGYAATRDLYIALGEGKLSTGKVRQAVRPSGRAAGRGSRQAQSDGRPAIIEIDASAPVTMCGRCLPLPSERITGIASDNQSITVHALYCDELAALADTEWIDLHWDENANRHPLYRTRIEVVLANVHRALARVCNRIGQLDANIEDVTMSLRRRDFFSMQFELSVRDLRHLHLILAAITAERVVYEAHRVGSDPEMRHGAQS